MPIDGGSVAFGNDPTGGKIVGIGTLRTGNLSFENPHAKNQKIILDHQLRDSENYILKEFEFVTSQGEHKSVMAWVPKSY